MYTVNLLPIEYRNYQLVMKRNNRIFLVMLIAVVALAVVLVTSIAISAIYAEQLDTIMENNAELAEQIDALTVIEELQSEADRMAASISQTAGLSPDWEKLLAEIGNAVPPTIVLDSISAGYTAEKNSITIKGKTDVLEDFTAMLDYFSRIEGIGEIHFKYSGDQAKPGSVSFQVDIQSLPAEPYALNLGGAE